MKKFMTFAAVTAASLLIFASCSNDDGDTTPPSITIVSPEDGAEVEPGETLTIDIDLTDNEQLASFKMEIHSNFDGHDHEDHAHALNSRGDHTPPFHFEKSWDISELRTKTHSQLWHVTIPGEGEFIEGDYHLMVYCFDASHNEAIAAHEIVIGHEHEHE